MLKKITGSILTIVLMATMFFGAIGVAAPQPAHAETTYTYTVTVEVKINGSPGTLRYISVQHDDKWSSTELLNTKEKVTAQFSTASVPTYLSFEIYIPSQGSYSGFRGRQIVTDGEDVTINGSYGVVVTYSTTLVEAHTHTWEYSKDGNKLIAKCTGSGTCPISGAQSDGISRSLTASGGTYDGSGKEATLSTDANWTTENGLTEPGSISYVGINGTTYQESTTAPKDAGDYRASVSVEGETATQTFTISPREANLSWSGTSFDYDGQNHAPAASVSNLASGDTCDVTVTGKQKEAGSYMATAESLSNSNYTLPSDNTTSFTINKKTLTLMGVTAKDKVYDGNTTANLNTDSKALSGIVGQDDVQIDTITGVYTGNNAKNVGTDKPIKVTVTLKGDAAGNYEVTSGIDLTADITAKPVTVSGITAADKDYDGTTNATVDASNAVFGGIVGEDKLSITATGAFEDASVGEDKTVNLTLGELDGADKGNYSIKDDSQTTATADITQKTITVSSGITSPGKIYDGKTTAPLDTSKAVLTGKVGDDDLAITAKGTFETKDVGTGKEVTLYGFELTGDEKDNYVLAGSGHQATTEGDITQKEAELEWTDTEFTYNGKDQKPKARVTNLEEGDVCTVTVEGEQTDANAKSGEDKYTATAKSLNNSNYKLPENVTCDFTIAPKELTQSMISLDSDTFKHDGTEKGPEVTMTDADITEENQPKQMVEGEDYTLSGDVKSSELGTHVITAEGKGNYTGCIETSWMIYNNKSNEDKEEGTEGKGDFEVFVDIENNTSTLTVDNLNISMAKGFLTQEDMARYNEGENVLVYMIFKEQQESEVESTDSSLLGGLFRTEGATDISWYDITVWKKIGNNAAVQVHDTIDELSMSVEVPDAQKEAPSGYTREFYLGRAHDGIASMLANTSKVKVGFSSSKFSTYALAYKDTKIPEPDPDKPDNADDSDTGDNGNGSSSSKGGAKTGDPNNIPGILALMLASGGALGAMGYRRRRETDK